MTLRSFFLGGFECSAHCRPDGRRLDLIASTCHDKFTEADYQRLLSVGMHSCRDGVRWHLIERKPGFYDFSSVRPMLRAATSTGIQVIWDILHYGWPADLDVFQPQFVDRFSRFCSALARLIRDEYPETPWFVAVNEPSFLCWAGAEMGIFPPFVQGRGDCFKKQLIRATIAGIEAVRSVIPEARFIQVDPLINIVPAPGADAATRAEAAGYDRAQFQCWDMLAGYLCPELGGDPKYLDVIGCNYYVHNQWEYGGRFIERTDPRHRPLHQLLSRIYRRYNRPLMIAETGIEDEPRPSWLAHVTDEVIQAMERGVPVEGVCLYPIVNHPGWDDDRHCHNGLWDYCNAEGHREIYRPLADELSVQQARLNAFCASPQRDRETASVFA